MRNRRPVVVVGGGVAGLVTALAAAPTPVRLLCRTHDGSGTASTLAQGGIAAALDPADSPAEHVRDTLTAGAQHNDAAMVRWLCAEAPAAIRWLAAQSVVFDRDATRGRRARRQCTLDRAWRIAGHGGAVRIARAAVAGGRPGTTGRGNAPHAGRRGGVGCRRLAGATGAATAAGRLAAPAQPRCSSPM
jgi:aspartate oxidase